MPGIGAMLCILLSGRRENLVHVKNAAGVDSRILGIFNTYGPRRDASDGRVVSNVIMQAVRGEPLTIYGDG